jgi:uncharacterized protein (TIGR02996 family)
MSDGEALRHAILAEPDDDIARLVYADWLDENGQPARAAFIRAQVRMAQAEPHSPEWRQCKDEARKALGTNLGAWTKHLTPRVEQCEFRRGFVEHAKVSAANFPRHAADLFAAEPIRSLHVTRFRSTETVSLLPFFEAPQLERITRLDFTGMYLAPVELEPIGECPRLANLTDLGLRDLPVMPDWIASLLQRQVLPALVGLDLSDDSHLGPRIVEVLPLLEHRKFARLDLSRITFTSAQLKGVFESRCLRELEELRLAWMTGVGHDGALAHLNPGWMIPWNRLRLLDLNGQGVGDDGVLEIIKALTRRKEPAPLRWLGLAHNRLGPDSVRALLNSDPAKVQLYYLDVRGNGLSLSQVASLQTRFPDAVVEHRDRFQQ